MFKYISNGFKKFWYVTQTWAVLGSFVLFQTFNRFGFPINGFSLSMPHNDLTEEVLKYMCINLVLCWLAIDALLDIVKYKINEVLNERDSNN